jgi:hypothetical protein
MTRPGSPWPVVRAALLLGLLAPGAAQAGVQVEGTLSRQHVLLPGQQAEGTIPVRNNSDQPVVVKVYQTEYRSNAEGRAWYEDPGTAGYPRSNSSWITFSPRLVTLAPQQRLYISYTVQVPERPDLIGTYWSTLMIEPQGAPVTPVQAQDRKTVVGITNIFRFCVQMIVHLGDTGARELAFADKRVRTLEGRRVLEIDLANPGQRSLSPLMWAEFHAQDGALALRAETHRRRIYPDCSARFTMDISALAPGPYEVLAVADNGDESVFGARYTLEIQ